MPFIDTSRVIYKRNPLDKVICQLRFSPILKIDSELPSEFQEMVRKDYPGFEEATEFQHEISALMNKNIPLGDINPVTKTTSNKNYAFISDDGFWKLNLTRTFLSITTTKYTKWEEFMTRFRAPIEALESIYAPPKYTRIGLRYIDVFCRSKFELSQSNWDELIKPQYIGLLSSNYKDSVQSYQSNGEIRLSDQTSRVRIITSLVQNTDLNNEECLMVDCDFFTTSRIDQDELDDKLEYLHERSTRLIRDIVTDKLHAAMEPTEIL